MWLLLLVCTSVHIISVIIQFFTLILRLSSVRITTGKLGMLVSTFWTHSKMLSDSLEVHIIRNKWTITYTEVGLVLVNSVFCFMPQGQHLMLSSHCAPSDHFEFRWLTPISPTLRKWHLCLSFKQATLKTLWIRSDIKWWKIRYLWYKNMVNVT